MMPSKIEQLLGRARQAIEARDWAKAKQVYLMALGLKSDMPDVHYGLATVYFQLRELTSAAHHFREVTRLDPLRAGAFINLGAVLNLLQQYDEALTTLRRGIQLDPQRVEGYYNLGLVYRRKGQLELAIQAYREALRLNQRMPDAHLNLGNLYYEKGQYKQAINHYDQALQIRPGWEKAEEGRAAAEEALNAEKQGPAVQVAAPVRARAEVGPDLERTADPATHAGMLTTLNQTAHEAEDLGREFQRLLDEELEPAIKELSSCLLYADGPLSEFDACIARFEAAMDHVRLTQHNLEASMGRLQRMSETFPAVE
jgi:tetratricopeptide (TPR) repeat protein